MIIDQNFVKTNYKLSHIPVKINIEQSSPKGGHPIWKNEWIHDKKEGGIIFVD